MNYNLQMVKRYIKKVKNGFFAAGCYLCSIVLLVSCSGVHANDSLMTSSVQERHSHSLGTEKLQDTLSEIAPAPIEDMTMAWNEMTDQIKLFKQAIESDDGDTAKQIAAGIASIWKAIELKLDDQELGKYQMLKDTVSSLLDVTNVEHLNKELLIQQAYELYQAIRELPNMKS